MMRSQTSYKALLKQRIEAAIVVQKWIRKLLAKKQLKVLKEHEAATTIQAQWRKHLKRKKFFDLKNKIILVESYARMWKAVKDYKILLAERQETAITIQKCKRNEAAIVMQKLIRKFLAKKLVNLLREKKAATTIQAAWRGYKARMALKDLVIAK